MVTQSVIAVAPAVGPLLFDAAADTPRGVVGGSPREMKMMRFKTAGFGVICALALGGLATCADEEPLAFNAFLANGSGGGSGGSGGSGSGSGESGDGTTGFGPTADCVTYLSCAASRESDAERQALLEARFGVGGECWESAASALTCDDTCEAQLDAYLAEDRFDSQCWPGGVVPASVEFGGDRTFSLQRTSSSGPVDCPRFFSLDIAAAELDRTFVAVPSSDFTRQPVEFRCSFERPVTRAFTCEEERVEVEGFSTAIRVQMRGGGNPRPESFFDLDVRITFGSEESCDYQG